jgi:hypothetical protein
VYERGRPGVERARERMQRGEGACAPARATSSACESSGSGWSHASMLHGVAARPPDALALPGLRPARPCPHRRRPQPLTAWNSALVASDTSGAAGFSIRMAQGLPAGRRGVKQGKQAAAAAVLLLMLCRGECATVGLLLVLLTDYV